MKKRITILMTTLLLTISVLSGCGAESTTTEPTETATATTTEESTTEQAEEATATSEETAEPTPEATEEPGEETTAETEPETTEPTETVEPEQTETPTTEPVPQYTYTDMSATMYVQQTVNVRDLPDTTGNKVGSLSTNDEITISAKCNETGWYMFEYNGSVAFVSNKYVSENKVEKPATSDSGNSDGSSTASNSCPYTLWQPVDNGTSITWYCAWPDPEWDTKHKSTLNWIYQTLNDRNTGNIPEGMVGGTEQTESTVIGNYAEGEVRRQTYEFHLYPADMFQN